MPIANKNEEDNSQGKHSKLSAPSSPPPTRGLPPNVSKGIMPIPSRRFQTPSATPQFNTSNSANFQRNQNPMNYGAHSANLNRQMPLNNNSQGFIPAHSINIANPNSMNLNGNPSASFNSSNLNQPNPVNLNQGNSFNLQPNPQNSRPLNVSQNINSPNSASFAGHSQSLNTSSPTSQSIDAAIGAKSANLPISDAYSQSSSLNRAFNKSITDHDRNAPVENQESTDEKNASEKRRQIQGIANSLLGSPSPTFTVETGVMPQQIERRNIFKENPNVYYLNGESLTRPISLPKDIKKKRWIFVVLAILIASFMLFLYFDQIVGAPARAETQMHELLARDTATNPPDLIKLLDRSDKKIKSSLKSVANKNDYSIIDITDEVDKDKEMTLMKIPSGLTEDEGKELISKGLSNLDALQLVSLLDGGWDLNVDRTSGLNISLHYADFKSTTPTKAIAIAIASEGLSRGTTTNSGDDDGFGNAYSSGSIMIKGVDYAWTVSSTYLKNVYSAYGIPDNATYVGIRIIKKVV